MFAKPHGMVAELVRELRLVEDLAEVARGRAMQIGVVVGIVEQPELHHPLPPRRRLAPTSEPRSNIAQSRAGQKTPWPGRAVMRQKIVQARQTGSRRRRAGARGV